MGRKIQDQSSARGNSHVDGPRMRHFNEDHPTGGDQASKTPEVRYRVTYVLQDVKRRYGPNRNSSRARQARPKLDPVELACKLTRAAGRLDAFHRHAPVPGGIHKVPRACSEVENGTGGRGEGGQDLVQAA